MTPGSTCTSTGTDKVLTSRPREAPLELTQSVRDISVTERGGFRTCRRRWVLEVLDNLTPKAPAWALEFGTGMHSALETYYETLDALRADPDEDPDTSDEPRVNASEVLEEWHDKMILMQRDHLGPLFSDAVKDDLWDLLNLGQTMLVNYDAYDRERQASDPWEILAIEGKAPNGEVITPDVLGGSDAPYTENEHPFIHEGRILCPIVHPDTGECLPGRPFLSGRLDLIVVRPKRHNTIWVVDHKTTATAPNDRGLDFDDQITGYAYLLWRLTGVIPRGTIFNYLVKQIPKDPRILKGDKVSTAKDQLCLAKDYRDALIAHDLMVKGRITSEAHAECYAGLLAKGWDPYFKWFEPQRNEHEVFSFEERLYQEYQDMIEVRDHQEKAYPNLSTWWCPSCSVAPICQAIEDGSDVESIIENRFMQAPDRKAER